MTQTVIFTAAILASLLTGWYVADTQQQARIRELNELVAGQRRHIRNLTRRERS